MKINLIRTCKLTLDEEDIEFFMDVLDIAISKGGKEFEEKYNMEHVMNIKSAFENMKDLPELEGFEKIQDRAGVKSK